MRMHNPAQVKADGVSGRAYLLAGFSALVAGVIAAGPISPPQPTQDAAMAPLTATSVTVPTAVLVPDADPVAPLRANAAAAVAPASVQPIEALAPTGTGIQLSLLTGRPNLGVDNVGDFNTGIANDGVANTGVVNDGNFNIGGFNTGDFNIGVSNTGNFNIGVSNDGDFNVGASNAGERNFGVGNSGTLNVGLANTGVANVGIGNNGNGNIGFFNTGDYAIGAFNIGIRYASSPAASARTTADFPGDSADEAEQPATSSTRGSTRRVSTADGNKVEPGDVARDTEQTSDKKVDADPSAEDASHAVSAGIDDRDSTSNEHTDRETDADSTNE
jgi:PPE-repeat protein